MERNTLPALKSCKHQCQEAKDGLKRLPDDIMLLIMSSLTMKEVARSSVLSHRMNHIWRCSPILIFENHSLIKGIILDSKAISEPRSIFSRWVNKIVEAHLGSVIDKFRVTFDLDQSCEPDVNKWVVFALLKQVKIIELDFTPASLRMYDKLPVELHLSLDQPHVAAFKHCLKSLSLKFVNITAQNVECLLLSFTDLENLCIVYSPSLTHVRAIESPLQLKHLKVSYCLHLTTIDILAPKLLSFRHHGHPIELNIRNASLLSEVSVGNSRYQGDIVAYAFNSLSKYFSQLEYLSWQIQLFEVIPNYVQFNLRIDNPPPMTKLKHLELHVFAICDQSLLGWADLIEASPLLERLTVKVSHISVYPSLGRRVIRRHGRPLKSLKTLEFSGNLGLPIDLEFVTYVVENSMMLKDVIIECIPEPELLQFISADAEEHDLKLERLLPQGVNLTLKTSEPQLCTFMGG